MHRVVWWRCPLLAPPTGPAHTVSYRSVMATCSSMAEPVLAFQFPEMDVLLWQSTRIRDASATLLPFPRWP